MSDETRFGYFIATMAVIGSMLIQGLLLYTGDASAVTFTIGQVTLVGCLVYLRARFKKEKVDNPKGQEL